jgi:ketose-bisphosphate aldolase
MPLEKVNEILKYAGDKKFGIAAFNVFNYESIAYTIETAEEEGLPVIVMFYPGMSDLITFKAFADITKDLAGKAKIPVGLHLDHCKSYETILYAIKNGFTSVMVDGASFEFEENVRITKEVVRAAHAMGVDVEAELGHVGSASNISDYTDTSHYTQPEKAVEFVERTGADCLAIAIGSAHGNYVKTPHLDIELLKMINAKVDVPLVLHGGTGIPDEQVREAIKNGICKINFGTGNFQTFYRMMNDYAMEPEKKDNLFDYLSYQKKGVKGFLRNRIRLLCS